MAGVFSEWAQRMSRSIMPGDSLCTAFRGRLRGQVFANQGLDALPHGRIALDFNVTSHENPVIPWILRTSDGIRGVIHPEVSENLRAGGIDRVDSPLAVQKALVLIKIYGLRDIAGNDTIVLAALGDTVHLDGQQHRNAIGLEVTRQCNHGIGAPAMS